ncbi:MAG: GAF domain-containing protein [Calditrichaeota bacterium]|nr:MAG: GAF domain-containing protein [Calditrichota bacterium]
MRNTLIMVVLFCTAAFINPSFLNSTTLFVLKIILFGGFIYLLYKQDKPATAPSVTAVSEPDPPVPPVASRPVEKKALKLPARFSRLLALKDGLLAVHLNRLFEIGFAFLHPNHGYFLLEEEGQITLLASETENLPITPRHTDFKAIFTLIHNAPQNILIENQLKDDVHLNRLYEDIPYSPGSLYIQHIAIHPQTSLYWIFDAKSNGFFNAQDLDVLIRLESLLREAIDDFLFRLETEIRQVKEKREKALYIALLNAADPDEALDAFVEQLAATFEAHKLTICLKDRDEKFPPTAHIYKSVAMEEAGRNGQKFPLEEGLAGRILLNDRVYLLEDIENGDMFIPRFSKDEKTNYDLHAFLGAPIHLNDEVWGAVILEHKKAGQYGNKDSRMLREMTHIFEYALERIAQWAPKKKEADG